MTEFQSLTTLIKRLEAATSRLEDLATSGASAVAVATNLDRNSIGSQPVAPSLVSPPLYDPNADAPLPPSLAAFDELSKGPLQNFSELSKKIGGLVENQSHSVEDGFVALRDFILIASQSVKPTTDTFTELIKPVQQAIEKVCEYREKNRPSSFFNHLSTVSEGIGALGWITLESKPAGYVGELKDSSQFYAHRVIKEFKDKDHTHVDWANSFIVLLTELQNYVKKCHATGLVWNPQGVDSKTFVGRKLSKPPDTVPPASGGGPPPPPPPPPRPALVPVMPPASSSSGSDMSRVFADINRGEAVTANLKKVDKSQMTHKNPSLRAGNTVGDVGAKAQKKGPTAPPKPASLTMKKSPKKIFDGSSKWNIEHFENNNNVMVEGTAINHTVYVFNCKNSTIQIKGKINAVTLDSCQKTGFLLDSTVGTIDVVNCKSFQLQILGNAPTITIDKSDSGQIFLSKECLGIEILTAKCSSINVCVPNESEDGDYAERPVPEQLKSTIVDGKLMTVAVEHAP